MENCRSTAGVENGAQECHRLLLASPNDLELLCPIRYVYNYLPHQPEWLKPQPVSLSRLFAGSKENRSASIDCHAEGKNSIYLHTQAAKLPLHTGLEKFQQSKYWKANEQATKELLELFAQDQRCSEVVLSDGRSMSSLAEKELKVTIIDTYSRFSIYMFAEAGRARIQLLAQSVILIFMFDGKQGQVLAGHSS